MDEKILGIYLGTGNSAACVFIDDEAIMIPSAEGVTLYGKTFPSIVAFTEHGEQLVGEPARAIARGNPENTVSGITRHMGTDYKVTIQGKEYTPQKISAMILQKIKRDAELFLGEPISKAVITVPTYFDNNQRTATKDAGKIAGFNGVYIINEPIAASLAYGLHKEEKNINILCFDLGEGTLDITIIEFNYGIFNILSTRGDTHLGGIDIENVLIKYVVDDFKKKHGIDLTQDGWSRRRLREWIKRAEIELSNLSETKIKIPFIAIDDDGSPLSFEVKITRSQFESLSYPILEKCGESIDRAIQDAEGINSIDDIDKVILLGETTGISIVQEYVERYTGKQVERGVDPVECIAIGASVQGAMLCGKIQKQDYFNVILSSLRIVFGSITKVMIKKNTPIPTKHIETFTTFVDNQTQLSIELVQGENQMADLNTKIGSLLFDGIQPAPRGVPQIEVTFEVDENGILNVTAHDQLTGNEKSITIEATTKMTEEEIREATEEAEANEVENLRRARLAEARNEADSQIYSAQNLIDDPNIKDQVDPSILESIQSLITELMQIKESEDARYIKIKTAALREMVDNINL